MGHCDPNKDQGVFLLNVKLWSPFENFQGDVANVPNGSRIETKIIILGEKGNKEVAIVK